jgi:hypothetical protein
MKVINYGLYKNKKSLNLQYQCCLSREYASHLSDCNFAGQGPVLLSPGIHSFPFKLGLPLGLPSTFLGKHGWVQYYCKAALREPNGLTHKNQQVFIVMNPIDLNLEPPILAVSHTETESFHPCHEPSLFKFYIYNYIHFRLGTDKCVGVFNCSESGSV